MKIKKKVICVTLALFCLNSLIFSQNVSLHIKSTTVKQAMETLKEKNGYSFVFSSGDVNTSKKISIEASDQPVDVVVKQILSGQDVSYEIRGKNIIVKKASNENNVPQKQKKISGVVTDAGGVPVIGANVIEKGMAANGTITDIDGNFKLDVAENSTLLISYIGYNSQEVSVSGRNSITIKLQEDTKALDEVVVIGYGTVKKSHLTGAVSSVSGKDLQANVARSASAALQGRIPGVTVSSPSGQPGEGMNINIRGISSLSSTTPLYVIDGVYGDINMVDPSDIQSIEVLKDASAAAIYGSRAANGVVLITTKGGKLETPTRITVDGYAGIQNVAKYIDVMDGNELRDFAKTTGYSSADGLIGWSGGKGTDWQKELYRTAFISKVGVNVSGGNKTSVYDLSGSYLKQEGIVKTTDYEAWNIRSKNSFSLFDNHVRLGSTVMLKMWRKDYDDVSYTSALTAVPQWNVYNENGDWGKAPTWSRGENPVGWVEAYDLQRHAVDLLLNGWAEVDLGIKGLKYKMNVGVNKYTRRNYNYAMPYVFSSTSQNPDYKLNESTNWENSWLFENTLHYDTSLDKNTISALAGYSAQRNDSRGFGAGRIGLPAGLQVIDAGLATTQTTHGSAWANSLISMFGRLMYSYDSRYMVSVSVRRDGSSKFSDGHRWGTFPSASIGWNVMNESFFENAKKTVNELKIRASYGVLGNLNGIGNYATQATTKSGLNDVWGGLLIPGKTTGVSWLSPADVTWEKTKTLNIGVDLSFLNNKLSINADYYVQKTEDMLLSMPQPGSFGLSGSPTMNAGTVKNNGFELALSHRNNIGELYYHLGANASFVKNELSKVNGSRREWTGFNPHDKGAVTYAMVGRPIGFFNLIKTDGIFKSKEEIDAYVNEKGDKIQPNAVPGDLKYIDYNKDGKINNLDRQDCGNAFPKMTIGFNLGAQWRSVDMNLFFDGNFGNKIYNAVYFSTVYNESTGNQYRERLNSWNESNKNSKVPRYVTGNDTNGTNWGYTDRWLENGSFFRLKTVEAGYTLPKLLTSKAYMQQVRLYLAVENLFTATGYKGYTPDLGINSGDGAGISGGSGVMTRGCDDGRYPTARTFTLGVQVNF